MRDAIRDRLERLANQTFEEFQADIRAGERMIAESDLYWRANRWEGVSLDLQQRYREAKAKGEA